MSLLFWLTRSNLTLHKFSSSWELHLTILFRNKMVELHKDITSCICQDIFKRKKYIYQHIHTDLCHLWFIYSRTSEIPPTLAQWRLHCHWCLTIMWEVFLSLPIYEREEGRKERQSQHRNQPWLVTVSFTL